jgi:hypothetical protein
VHGRDGEPSTHHKSQHDKHHHHHSRSGSSGGSNNRKQPTEAGLSSTSTKQQAQQQPQASASYKNQQQIPQASSSSSQRQRPNSQQQPGQFENVSKPVHEDRTQHRQIVQEVNPYSGVNLPRPIEQHNKQRQPASQQPPPPPPQSNNPHMKPTNHDQRHSSQSLSTKTPIDYHQKNVKHPQNGEYRSSSSMSHSQQPQAAPQQQQMSHKKPTTWPQQSSTTTHQSNLQKSSTNSAGHVQASHSQPSSSNSNNRGGTSLPSYNESTKQLQGSASQPIQTSSQNDYWFNDKLIEAPTLKIPSPVRPIKSMFSPSPEHDAFDRTKMMMMAASATKQRTDSPKSDKQDRRSSTPIKREKRSDLSTTPTSQKVDRKPIIPKIENSSVPPLVSDSKKRPFASLLDDQSEFNRDSKSRKTEVSVKIEPSMKQSIETNPDIVKSLLQECYTSNKFDSFGGMDSPLDVINPEPIVNPPTTLLQPKLEINDSVRDNGHEEEHHKRNKSKKKKEKHRHKEKHQKKKKSHKSDREDRSPPKETSLKIILSKDKSDSKSSPESVITPGGLKIKIPIKDVNKTDLVAANPQMPQVSLKLKIPKMKIGGFNNSVGDDHDGGSSSSSHKKKDKDRSKSKSSKHGNNNNISEYKDAGYPHQPMNKVS